jgi:uncharacterized protein YkwD
MAPKLLGAARGVKCRSVIRLLGRADLRRGGKWHLSCFINTMIPRISAACLALFYATIALAANEVLPKEEHVTASAIVREMNLARQSPAFYATYVEQMRSRFNGKFFLLPGQTKLFPKEGLRAIDEAIRFLHTVQPEQPLVLSLGMSRAAAEHCADQIGGAIGHDGSDRSNPAARISRYGVWTLGWGENIAYGKTTARDIVLALVIDDGIPGRKHRKNIFNPKFNFAGAGYGPHARFHTVCSIDFAGGYIESGRETERELVARNY